ncbi:hypothetical protein VaNZ11_009466 [Volvox africanus]|uniref:Uncharacterized protein n=1 Tax=Volvox africanus TaxID=51714 RepID=A0ABQ5S7L7_9CHLO|nr:hypothetical protein VaNZ11_009466 [Volvox africanus]
MGSSMGSSPTTFPVVEGHHSRKQQGCTAIQGAGFACGGDPLLGAAEPLSQAQVSIFGFIGRHNGKRYAGRAAGPPRLFYMEAAIQLLCAELGYSRTLLHAPIAEADVIISDKVKNVMAKNVKNHHHQTIVWAVNVKAA